MEVGRRRVSPERGRVMKPTFKKVEVVYYLSTNGLLQHPHYLQLAHLTHQQVRLKDVLDRLTLLRGKAMPLLYSWSCKRSYKNGYVWNDLAQNDVIFPSQGGEYVLKGSELLADCTQKLHDLQVGNEPPFQEPSRRHPGQEKERMNAGEEEEKKAMQTTCSRGVSTDEIEPDLKHTQKQSELNLDANSLSSPPSTASSTLSDNNPSDPIGNEPMLSRNSMLFNIIACGGSASFRKAPVGRKSNSLQKGAATAVEEEDRLMIDYMSENPRFGNTQAEEKEYFSGSIAEQMMNDCERIADNDPALKKSSSYNQERRAKARLREEEEAEEEKEEVKKNGFLKGKCIPRKKKSSSKEGKM